MKKFAKKDDTIKEGCRFLQIINFMENIKNMDIVEETPEDSRGEQQEESLKKVIVDLEERLLRAIADSQNAKKIYEKEKTDMAKYCISGFARDILSIRDTLKLALQNCSEANISAVLDGINMTLFEMDKILEKNGVSIINAIDSEFDPNLHEAISQIESNDKKHGTVIEILQDGFLINGRLLRPALVSVSKGKQTH